MKNFTGTPATILGTIVSLAALAAWCVTAPAAGSGWILFIAFIGSISHLNTIEASKRNMTAAVASLLIAGAAGFAWYTHQGFEHVWWVGFLGVIAGIHAFQNISAASAKEGKDDSN